MIGTTLRTSLVLLLFLLAAAVMLRLSYHNLVALESSAAIFASQLEAQAAASNNLFESDKTDEMRMIGDVCEVGPRFDASLARTKACRDVATLLGRVHAKGAGFLPSVAAVVLAQLSFVILAGLAVAVSLAATVGLAVLIDWLAESLGWRRLSQFINRIIDTLPYTIWLVVMAALFNVVISTFDAPDRAAMSLQTRGAILLGQLVIYLGVSALLMPLFLNFLLETLRTARRNGIFDMVAMDGLKMRRAYRRIVFGESRHILFKAMLFGTLFVLLFDPVFERLSGKRVFNAVGELNDPAVVVPLQAFQSPFYQWALLRFDDADDPLFETSEAKAIEADIAKSAAADGGSFLVSTAVMLRGPAASANLDSARIAMEFNVFPALLLDASRWRTLIADKAACERSAACRGVRDGGGVGERMARLAVRSGFAAAYFYFNMSMLFVVIGVLATWESWRNYNRRMEQV